MSEDRPAFDGKDFVRHLSTAPGVYRMLDAQGNVLYIGKANALRNRVSNYFNQSPKSPRIQTMIAQIASMEVTVTRTEAEALILENELIKSLKPRYNVLLRDGKSYAYILLTDAEVPRVMSHRGPRSVKGQYYGPYPSGLAIRETLNLIQKLFKLRSCEDSVFRNRSRPCLQYQIGRCSAPCVDFIEPDEYAESVARARMLLEGRSDDLTADLSAQMQAASEALNFERAARLRDLIAAIRTVQARQYVDGRAADLDVLALAREQGAACVVLLAFRDGRNFGTRSFFPRIHGGESDGEILSAFIAQYYLEHNPPMEIVTAVEPDDRTVLEEALASVSGRKVRIRNTVRGERANYVEMTRRTAELALTAHVFSHSAQLQRVKDLQALLGLAETPNRIECFDISHTMGEATVASCVVFDRTGAVRQQYRRFNITGIEPGDDYAAMHQALTRRFRRAIEEGTPLPDVLLIDGGKGQIAQARDVLTELQVQNVTIVGVAKGPERKAGEETLILPDGTELQPGAASPGLQFVQQVRDEAHRFAITGHRGKRQKARNASALEGIDGVGPKRRSQMLKHFGGLQGLKAAGIEEIARVDGISDNLAERIYAALHGIDA